MKPTLITCYVNPDLDGVAGVVAYGEFLQKIGQSVSVGIIGAPHDEAKYILDRFALAYPPVIENTDDFNFYIILLVVIYEQ